VLLPFTKSSDWISTHLLLLDNKVLQQCDHNSTSKRSLLSLAVEQRCEKISETLKCDKLSSRWIPMWMGNKLNEDEETDTASTANGTDSNPLLHSLNRDKPYPSCFLETSLQNTSVDEIRDINSDEKHTQEAKKKLGKQTDCVVPRSPQHSEICTIPSEAVVPCDVEFSQRSFSSQLTPTRLGLEKLQGLNLQTCFILVTRYFYNTDELNTFTSNSNLSQDMKVCREIINVTITITIPFLH
jgi:hypothetical protein